jgi:hypothetical protein
VDFIKHKVPFIKQQTILYVVLPEKEGVIAKLAVAGTSLANLISFKRTIKEGDAFSAHSIELSVNAKKREDGSDYFSINFKDLGYITTEEYNLRLSQMKDLKGAIHGMDANYRNFLNAPITSKELPPPDDIIYETEDVVGEFNSISEEDEFDKLFPLNPNPSSVGEVLTNVPVSPATEVGSVNQETFIPNEPTPVNPSQPGVSTPGQ